MTVLNSAEYLRSAILFVVQNQNDDGGFTSKTSQTASTAAVDHQTIFYPALIASLLIPIKSKETADIVKKINYFLSSHTNQDGLWSYWATNNPVDTEFSYPPDLDDTSLAIAVQAATGSLKTNTLVQFVESLIYNETEPGGPYKTWITNHNDEHWSDVDPVVNASIAYALKQQSVRLQKLNQFLIDRIKTNTWDSPYYVSKPLSIFLIDRALNGQCDEHIQAIVEKYSHQEDLSVIERALLLLLMIHIDSDYEVIITYVKDIIAHGQAYIDDPIILERQTASAREVSGCAALTAATCALAISCFMDYESNRIKPIMTTSTESRLHDEAVSLVAKKLNQLDHHLFTVGLQEFGKLIAAPVAREITLISFDTGRAFAVDLPSELYVNLGAANLWGWLSYQLYDACYDEGIISENLSLANICLREATMLYHTMANQYNVPSELVTDTLDHIDLAHAVELKERANACFSPQRTKEWLIGGTLNLCERSFGHCLGPQLISIMSRQTKETQKQLKKLFAHYLNARQICDDLHDWQEDYTANRLTSVTKPLFLSQHAFPIINNEETAKKIFWEEGIIVGIHQAQRELEDASYVMRKINWYKSPPTILSASLSQLRQSLERVEHEHRTMKALIKQYS